MKPNTNIWAVEPKVRPQVISPGRLFASSTSSLASFQGLSVVVLIMSTVVMAIAIGSMSSTLKSVTPVCWFTMTCSWMDIRV